MKRTRKDNGPGYIYKSGLILGSGGFSTVYLGRNLQSRKVVALKIANPSTPRVFFENEIRALRTIQGDHVPELFSYGTDGSRLWMALEKLEGETLASRIDHGVLSLPEAIGITIQMERALATAHEVGWVHGDVKPANIFLGKNGVASLIDWGLARRTTDPVPEEEFYCTPEYVAPEVILGSSVTPAQDRYSLATVFHEMITGLPPVRGATALSLFEKKCTFPPELGNMPHPLDRFFQKALHRNPEKRHSGGKAYREDLQKFLNPVCTKDWGRDKFSLPTDLPRISRKPFSFEKQDFSSEWEAGAPENRLSDTVVLIPEESVLKGRRIRKKIRSQASR